MRGAMRNGIVRYSIYAAAVLVALLALNGIFDLGIGPVPVFLAAIFVPCVLIALWKFPAAFIVPVLFMPKLKPLPLLPARFQSSLTALALATSRVRHYPLLEKDFQGSLTVLGVAIVLLCAAILFRLALLATRRTRTLGELFRIQKRGILAYFLFAAVVTISYTYTHAPDYGGDKLLRFLTIGTLCFLAPFVLLREEKDFRHLLISLVGVALVAGWTRVAETSGGTFSAHEEVVHIGIGQLIGMTIVLVLYFRRLFEGRLARFLLLLCLPFLFAGLIASEVRGAMIWSLLVISLFAFIRQPNVGPRLSQRVFALGAAAVVAMLFLMPPTWVRGEAAHELRTKQEELVMLMQGKDSKHSAGKRLDFYRGALHGLSVKPVLGWGVGGWSAYYFHTDDMHYPHNLFLEVGVEEGLLGLAALLALLATAFGAARTVFREGGERFAFLLPVLIFSVGVTMTSGDIDDNRFVWFWCGTALVVYGMVKSHTQEAPTNQALVL